MTLDQLRAELAALALAYPGETPVLVHNHGSTAPVTALSVDSDESGVTVQLEVAL